MKLPFAPFGTENSAAVRARVYLEPDDVDRTGGIVGAAGKNSQLARSIPGGEIPAVGRRGGSLRSNVKNLTVSIKRAFGLQQNQVVTPF